MNPENVFDKSAEMRYNINNNGIYDTVADNLLSQPQIIKLDEHEPVNDLECKHEVIISDPTDTIGNAVYHGCANPKCGRGYYLKQ